MSHRLGGDPRRGAERRGSSRETSPSVSGPGPCDPAIDPGREDPRQPLPAADRGLLQAGYLEDWRYHDTLSGAPQGGVLSPLLSNIYLDRLDRYVETGSSPVYNQGDRRRPYHRICGCTRPSGSWRRKGSGKGPGRCAGKCSNSPPVTPTIRVSGGCIMSATRTIGCWGSPVRDGKPRISRARSGGSWATASSWNSPSGRP